MNLTKEQIKEANELIDLVRDAIKDLNHFSVDNDDIFNPQTYNMEEILKDCRKQLI